LFFSRNLIPDHEILCRSFPELAILKKIIYTFKSRTAFDAFDPSQELSPILPQQVNS